MERAGNEFFASAAFAVDENAAVGGSSDTDLLAQRFHRDTFTDDLITVAEFRAEGLVFLFQAALLNGVANEDDDFFEGERFFDEVEGAELGGADGGIDGGVTGDHDDGGWMGKSLDAGEGFEAV